MSAFPSHPKIFTLGQRFSESYEPDAIFETDVCIEEKVDGSQFGFGITKDGEFLVKSRKQILDLDNPESMFEAGVEYLKTIKDMVLEIFAPDVYFYCEYLRQPKHNLLKYDRIPKNHFVLFGACFQGEWEWNREILATTAEGFGIDVIPTLYHGHASPKLAGELLETDSYLGGTKVEGVVIKNYNQMFNFFGDEIPMIAKLVGARFKETNENVYGPKSENQTPIAYAMGFRTEARWEKAIQHLREQGILMGAPQDIGNLINEIRADILAEDKREILNWGGDFVLSLVLKEAIKGLPEWYKNKLVTDMLEKE